VRNLEKEKKQESGIIEHLHLRYSFIHILDLREYKKPLNESQLRK
jgi:hypothetical protein